MNEIINVNFDNNKYKIYIRRNIIDKLATLLKEKTQNNKVVIIADSFFEYTIVKKIFDNLKQKNFFVYIYLMDAGKCNKNINEVLKIYSILEENNLARDSTIIAIGGGVIGDLAGFIASTWYRGMNLVHIPTTLMAMVDSSVGGKVAINFKKTINAIGNYYHPLFTLIDLNLINTLSERDYKSGLAEVIKCAIISDNKFYTYLEKNIINILNREDINIIYFISKSINIKIMFVQNDIKEDNKRLLLNYGHTLGHAIEISTEINNKEQYRHGECVSLGIMAILHISKNYLGISQKLFDNINNLFIQYNLPTFISSNKLGFNRNDLIKQCIINVNKDKKRINNNLRLILSENIGKASIYTDIPFNLIENAFQYIIRK